MDRLKEAVDRSITLRLTRKYSKKWQWQMQMRKPRKLLECFHRTQKHPSDRWWRPVPSVPSVNQREPIQMLPMDHPSTRHEKLPSSVSDFCWVDFVTSPKAFSWIYHPPLYGWCSNMCTGWELFIYSGKKDCPCHQSHWFWNSSRKDPA